jgi:hypothetical protein
MMHRVLTISGFFTGVPGSKPVPALRLQGIWLKSLGFSVGCKVSITAENGVITIRLLVIRFMDLPAQDKLAVNIHAGRILAYATGQVPLS